MVVVGGSIESSSVTSFVVGEVATIEAEGAALISMARAKLGTLRQRQSWVAPSPRHASYACPRSTDEIVEDEVCALLDSAEATIVSAETLQVCGRWHA